MTILSEILDFNDTFVAEKQYEQYATTKFPDKRIVILTCMDTRLTELLPKAMNLKNGDAKIIKSAGAVVTHPFGGIMRSLLVAVYDLCTRMSATIHQTSSGMSAVDTGLIIEKMVHRGIDKNIFKTLNSPEDRIVFCLHGFGDVTESVKMSVDAVRNHPLMDKKVAVHGLVVHPNTGKLDIIIDGYMHNSND